MKEIVAEGTRYIYVTKADGIPADQIIGSSVGEIHPIMAEYLLHSIDVRLVLIRYLWQPQNRPDPYYLYWDDGSDLDVLDQKVEDDVYTDDDFVRSFKTEYDCIKCPNCGRRWPCLVMYAGDPYLGAPSLIDEKFKRANFLSCPYCGYPLRAAAVKILGDGC